MNDEKNFSYYGYVAKISPNLYLTVIVQGVLIGVAYALLFPIIFYSFAPQDFLQTQFEGDKNYTFFNSPNSNVAIIFVINCAALYCLKLMSSISSALIEQKAELELKNQMYLRVSRASISDIERVGSEKLALALNSDVNIAVAGSMAIVIVVTSTVTVVGLLGYLSYLNFKLFTLILMLVLAGILMNSLLSKIAERYLRRGRDTYDILQENVGALIKGIKELKVNEHKKNLHFSEGLDYHQVLSSKQYLHGRIIHFFSSSITDLMLFIIIGLATFHFSYVYFVDLNSQVGIVMVLLYLTGPLVSLVNGTQTVIKGKISFNKILDVFNRLPNEKASPGPDPIGAWNQLVLRDLCYTYVDHVNECFNVGAINLTLNKGEVVYLVGGNGSGKSTLAKLITMHYTPTNGQLLFDTNTINEKNIAAARQHIGIVFTDFYLFKKIYGYTEGKDKHLVDKYLKYFCLDNKVSINKDGVFSTLSLSDGQRKRLALLAAILENKDIYVFDEWAADQDPQFKKIFYEKIVPELKANNKLVILVTHDDAYFYLADRIVHMDYGQIVSVQTNSGANPIHITSPHHVEALSVT